MKDTSWWIRLSFSSERGVRIEGEKWRKSESESERERERGPWKKAPSNFNTDSWWMTCLCIIIFLSSFLIQHISWQFFYTYRLLVNETPIDFRSLTHGSIQQKEKRLAHSGGEGQTAKRAKNNSEKRSKIGSGKLNWKKKINSTRVK